MKKPRLLDLFCGAGGASVGYHRAGFEVVGVDIAEQPNYPFEFHRADALSFDLDGFDAVHASPPCQRYVGWQRITEARGGKNEHPDLVGPVRERVGGGRYVIENVAGSPLRSPLTLCGSTFGLGVRRHRLFESSVLLLHAGPCRHRGDEIGVYGRRADGRRLYTRRDSTILRAARSVEEAKAAMGVGWMETWEEVKEAIPPAYTEFIGRQLIAAPSLP